MSDELEKLIFDSLGYSDVDRICLIHDTIYTPISKQILSYCRSRNVHIKEMIFDTAPTLSSEIKEAFLSDSNNILIVASDYNIWHSTYRKDAKYKKNKRLVNLLHPDSVCQSYLADVNEMSSLGKRIFASLSLAKDRGDSVHIVTKDGTDLQADIGKIFCETGDYSHPCSGGDYPAGEVGFGPVEGSVKGWLAYNYKIQHVGFLEKPFLIRVVNDKIIFPSSYPEFEKLISQNDAFNYISEISIGINPIWSETDNIKSIVEEKNLGTIHFGQGGNFPSYGNRQGPHFDSVIKHPTVFIGNIELIKDGFFSRNYINL